MKNGIIFKQGQYKNIKIKMYNCQKTNKFWSIFIIKCLAKVK